MLRLLKRIFAGLFLLLIAGIVYKVMISPQMIIPYPYEIEDPRTENWEDVAEAHVLVVGDRMTQTLANYRKPLQALSSKGLKEELNVAFWAREKEGIHRTIEKLEFLAKKGALPKILVYHGASQEFYEKRVRAKDIKNTMKNFELFENDKFSSALMLLPPLSRLVYWPIKRVKLGSKPKKDERVIPASLKQSEMELTYKFFDSHIREMVDLAREYDRQLILTTTPINLEWPPKETCNNAQTPMLQKKLGRVQKLAKSEKSKEAYSLARDVAQKSLAHAHAYHWWGKTALDMGNFHEAKEALTLALAYDCSPQRTSPVFNGIIRSHSSNEGVQLVDFDKLVNQHLGRNVLFLNWLYPQHLFYQQFVEILATEVRHYYQIK